MNRNPGSLWAASRTPWSPATRLPPGSGSCVLPDVLLDSPPPSSHSARLIAFVRGLLWYTKGVPFRPTLSASAGVAGISWFPCIESPCVPGVYDSVEPGRDLAVSIPSVWPSAHPDCVGAPDRCFRSSIPRLHVPLSTLQGIRCGAPRMTRGQDSSLLLSCMTLSFTTQCRLVPAHRDCQSRTFHHTFVGRRPMKTGWPPASPPESDWIGSRTSSRYAAADNKVSPALNIRAGEKLPVR